MISSLTTVQATTTWSVVLHGQPVEHTLHGYLLQVGLSLVSLALVAIVAYWTLDVYETVRSAVVERWNTEDEA